MGVKCVHVGTDLKLISTSAQCFPGVKDMHKNKIIIINIKKAEGALSIPLYPSNDPTAFPSKDIIGK
jgi:hypothetical protein